MTSRLLSLLLLLLVWLHVATPAQAQAQADPQTVRETQEEIQLALTRAETWYWWARASANAEEHHQRSKASYERARQAALRLPDNKQQPWLAHADAGLAQVEARVDNSWDTFRSVYAPVWWFLEADPTIETSDDAEMLAVANAWKATRASVLGGRLVDQYWAVVRCSDCREDRGCQAELGDGIDCTGLRDELMIHIDADPRLNSVTDDRLRSLLPWDWQQVLTPDSVPSAELGSLTEAMDLDRLLLLDMRVADVVEQEPGVLRATRIDMTARVWDREEGVISMVRNTGIGAAAWDRVVHRLGWIFTMLFAAWLWALGWGMVRDRDDDWTAIKQRIDDLFVATACWLLGALVGWLASQVSAGLLPEWGTTAISSIEAPLSLPRAEVLQWPAAHGAVVLLGSLIASSLLAPRVLPRFSARLRDNVDLGIVTVTALAGALAMLFAPIVHVVPGHGWWIAGTLSAASLAVGAFTVPSLSHVLGQRFGRALNVGWGEDPRHPHLGVLLGFAGLLFLLPLGLFNGWEGWVAIAAGLFCIPLWHCWRPRRSEAAPTAQDVATRGEAETRLDRLQRPAWTGFGDRDPDAAAEWLTAADGCRLMLIEGPASSGKTRLMEEIRTRLEGQEAWEVGAAYGRESTREGQGGVSTTEAYDLIIQSLHSLGLGISSRGIRDRTDRGDALGAAFETALTNLPGFGLLFDLTLSGQDQRLGEDKIRRDMIKAIRSLAKGRRLLLCLDDVHWADPSSIELLGEIVQASNDRGRSSVHIAIIATAWPEGPEDTQQSLDTVRQLGEAESEPDVRVQDLHPMTQDDIRTFLESAGLSQATALALSRDAGQYTRARPGETVDFVRALLGHGLLRRMDSGEVELAGPLDPQVLAKAIPPSSKERYHRLLDSLEANDIALLECAALCGRVFSVEDVAAGLQKTRMETVQGLRAIEDGHGLVVDPEEPDDHFAFTSAILQSTLLERLYKPRELKDHSRNREHAKEMHRHIAESLLHRSTSGQALRIAGHCMGAGPRMAKECVEQAQLAARYALGRYAKSETKEALGLARRALAMLPDGVAKTDAETRFDYLQACEQRATADRTQRQAIADKLAPWMKLLTPRPIGWLQPSELSYTHLECLYEGKERLFLERILEETQGWLALPSWGDVLSRTMARFYQICAKQDLRRLPDPVEDLRTLGVEIEALPAGRARDLLLSKVQNRRANAMVWNKQRNDPINEVIALLESSNELKREHGDQRGLAMGLGSLGSVLLLKAKDHQKAYQLLDEDLKLVENMGFETDVSSILNRMAQARWGMVPNQKGQARFDMQMEAIEKAVRATTLAIRFGQSFNFAMAHANVHLYMKSLSKAGKKIRSHESATELRAAATDLAASLEDAEKLAALESAAVDTKQDEKDRVEARSAFLRAVDKTKAAVKKLLAAFDPPASPTPQP